MSNKFNKTSQLLVRPKVCRPPPPPPPPPFQPEIGQIFISWWNTVVPTWHGVTPRWLPLYGGSGGTYSASGVDDFGNAYVVTWITEPCPTESFITLEVTVPPDSDPSYTGLGDCNPGTTPWLSQTSQIFTPGALISGDTAIELY